MLAVHRKYSLEIHPYSNDAVKQILDTFSNGPEARWLSFRESYPRVSMTQAGQDWCGDDGVLAELRDQYWRRQS
jgi:hypothetical protein